MSVSANRISTLCTRLSVMGVVWIGLFVSESTAQTDEPNQKVQAYLAELELDSILIEHLHQQMNETVDRKGRVELAGRLAKLYAKGIFSSDQAGNSEERLLRIRELATSYPEIDSPDLRTTVMHSEYVDAENAFIRWGNRGRPASEREKQIEAFQLIGKRLKRQLNKLETKAFEAGNARLFAQASYLYAWSCYYRGLLETEERDVWMGRSETSFRGFLEIDDKKPVTEFASHWFDVQSTWNARALVGLAMTLRAQGRQAESKYCFNILEGPDADPQIRRNLDVWRLNSYLYLERMDEAFEFLRRRAADSEQDSELQTRLWVASISASMTCPDGRYSKQGVQFIRFGLQGLVSSLNGKMLSEVVASSGLNLAGDDFLLTWCRGYIDFYQAERTHNNAGYLSAKRELNWAVRQAPRTTDPSDLAKCSFLLGLIEFQLRNYQSATELLEKSIPELVERSPDLAAEAQWIVVRSFQMLAKSDPRHANDAFNAMDKLVRSFPNSKYVRRVEFEKLLMEVAEFPPEEAIRRLKKIQREDSNYTDSVFEQLKLQHQLWLGQQKSKSPRTRVSFDQLLESERAFHQLYPTPVKQQRIKATLLVIDALIRMGDNLGLAKRKLAEATELLRSMDPVSPSATELQYYFFQLARIEGDLEQMQKLADWFYLKVPDSSYAQSTLVALAQSLRSRQRETGEPTRAQMERLARAYQRILDLMGSDVIVLTESRNARVAATKLVEVYYELGKYRLAEPLVDSLLSAFPNRKDILQWSSRLKMKTGDFPAALKGWRTLVRAVEPGIDDWYEAKIGVIESLSASDAEMAKAVLKQTVELGGKLPDQWKKAFATLDEKLNNSATPQDR